MQKELETCPEMEDMHEEMQGIEEYKCGPEVLLQEHMEGEYYNGILIKQK